MSSLVITRPRRKAGPLKSSRIAVMSWHSSVPTAFSTLTFLTA